MVSGIYLTLESSVKKRAFRTPELQTAAATAKQTRLFIVMELEEF
jgi:hypothetical protein